MHHFAAAKSDLMRVESVCIIAWVIPLGQLGRLSFSKRGLSLNDSLRSAALRAFSPERVCPITGALASPICKPGTSSGLQVAASAKLLWRQTGLLLQYEQPEPRVLLSQALTRCGAVLLGTCDIARQPGLNCMA